MKNLSLGLLLVLAACGGEEPYREVILAVPSLTATGAPAWEYTVEPHAWRCLEGQRRLDFFVGEVASDVIAHYRLTEHGATFRLFDVDVRNGQPVLVTESTPKYRNGDGWNELVLRVPRVVRNGWYSVQVPHRGDYVAGLLVR